MVLFFLNRMTFRQLLIEKLRLKKEKGISRPYCLLCKKRIWKLFEKHVDSHFVNTFACSVCGDYLPSGSHTQRYNSLKLHFQNTVHRRCPYEALTNRHCRLTSIDHLDLHRDRGDALWRVNVNVIKKELVIFFFLNRKS